MQPSNSQTGQGSVPSSRVSAHYQPVNTQPAFPQQPAKQIPVSKQPVHQNDLPSHVDSTAGVMSPFPNQQLAHQHQQQPAHSKLQQQQQQAHEQQYQTLQQQQSTQHQQPAHQHHQEHLRSNQLPFAPQLQHPLRPRLIKKLFQKQTFSTPTSFPPLHYRCPNVTVQLQHDPLFRTPVSQGFPKNSGQPRQSHPSRFQVPPQFPPSTHQMQVGSLPPPPPYKPNVPSVPPPAYTGQTHLQPGHNQFSPQSVFKKPQAMLHTAKDYDMFKNISSGKPSSAQQKDAEDTHEFITSALTSYAMTQMCKEKKQSTPPTPCKPFNPSPATSVPQSHVTQTTTPTMEDTSLIRTAFVLPKTSAVESDVSDKAMMSKWYAQPDKDNLSPTATSSRPEVRQAVTMATLSHVTQTTTSTTGDASLIRSAFVLPKTSAVESDVSDKAMTSRWYSQPEKDTLSSTATSSKLEVRQAVAMAILSEHVSVNSSVPHELDVPLVQPRSTYQTTSAPAQQMDYDHPAFLATNTDDSSTVSKGKKRKLDEPDLDNNNNIENTNTKGIGVGRGGRDTSRGKGGASSQHRETGIGSREGHDHTMSKIEIEKWSTFSDGPLCVENMQKKYSKQGHHSTMYTLEPGTYFPDHIHDNPETFSIVSGQFQVCMLGEAVLLQPGDIIVVPNNTVHNAKVIGNEKVVLLGAKL